MGVGGHVGGERRVVLGWGGGGSSLIPLLTPA